MSHDGAAKFDMSESAVHYESDVVRAMKHKQVVVTTS